MFGAQSGKHLYDASNIFSKLGNPDKDSSLRKLESFYPNLLSSAYSDEKKQSIFAEFSKVEMDFLNSLLKLEPEKRSTALQSILLIQNLKIKSD